MAATTASDDRLEAGLARITARLDARRAATRAALEREPELLELATVAREIFGAKLAHLAIGEHEDGDRDAYRRLPDGRLGVGPVLMSPPQPIHLARKRRNTTRG